MRLIGFVNFFLAIILINIHCQSLAEENASLTEKHIDAKESLGLIKNVHLVVVDDVSDKCWTNISQIKQKVRLTLEQSGIHVYEEPIFIISPFSTNLAIIGLGMRSDDGTCFGSLQMIAQKKASEEFLGAKIEHLSSNFIRSAISISPSSLNEQFINQTETFVSSFAADVISNRRNPYVKEMLDQAKDTTPMTMKRLYEITNESNAKKKVTRDE